MRDSRSSFNKYMVLDNYSNETIKSYNKVLDQFESFLAKKYKRHKESFEINPSDIRNYLKNQIDNNKKVTTINKELAILKTYFNHLWEEDIIKIDPCSKIKPFKNEYEAVIEISYEEIIATLKKVLVNPKYSSKRKSIFLLATKGLRTSDFRFKKNDVKIDEMNEKQYVQITLSNRNINLNREEGSYFIEYYNESLFYPSDYVYTTQNMKDNTYGEVQVMTILNHLRAISKDYFPDKDSLTLVSIRRAIFYHLYYNLKMPIQKIAEFLGVEETSVSNYLKQLKVC